MLLRFHLGLIVANPDGILKLPIELDRAKMLEATRRGRSRRLNGCNGGLNGKRHSSPTVSPLSLGKDIPPLRLRRLAQNV